jgi:hypothetical protein
MKIVKCIDNKNWIFDYPLEKNKLYRVTEYYDDAYNIVDSEGKHICSAYSWRFKDVSRKEKLKRILEISM